MRSTRTRLVAAAALTTAIVAAIAPAAHGLASTQERIPIGDYQAALTNFDMQTNIGTALLHNSEILQPHGAGVVVTVDPGSLAAGEYQVRLGGGNDQNHIKQTKVCLLEIDASNGGECYSVFRTNATTYAHVAVTITRVKSHHVVAGATFS